MGLPNSVKWYHILGAGIALGSYDAYRYALRKSSDLYDYSCDILDSGSLLPTPVTNKSLLYQLALSAPPKPFHQFASLPAEIRCHIWRLACEEPRTIEIRQPAQKNLNVVGSPYSICKIPTPLHVCTESRGEALKSYERSFAMPCLLAEGKGIYINFSRDTVYFGNRGDFYGLLTSTKLGVVPGLDKVKNLAFRGLKWGDVRRWDFDVLEQLEGITVTSQEMGERRFVLGREPMLVRGEPNECFLYNPSDLPNRMGEEISRFRERFAELDEPWIPPVVTLGRFVKGAGDKWSVRAPEL